MTRPFRPLQEAAWLLVLALAALSALRGEVGRVQVIGEINWFATYEHGFMRRALAGTVFHGLFGGRAPDSYQAAIVVQHWAAVALLAVLAVVGLRFAARRAADPLLVILAGALMAASQVWPTLTYDVGYLDPQILILVGLGVAAIALGWPVVAAAIACIGPLAHEQFLFYWAPLAVAQGLLRLGVDRAGLARSAMEVLLLAVPMLGVSALVLAFHSPEAARLAVAATPMEENARKIVLEQVFGMSINDAFAYMRFVWSHYLFNGVISIVVFAGPALVLGLLTVRAFRNLKAWPWLSGALLVGMFGTLSILSIAWDLSRFASLPPLLWAAVTVLIAARRPPPAGADGGVPPNDLPAPHSLIDYGLYALAGLALAASAATPFVFTYFNSFAVLRGVYPAAFPLEAPVQRWFAEHYSLAPL